MGYFNNLFTPKDLNCDITWMKCHKFSTFLKLVFIAIFISLALTLVRFVQGEYFIAKVDLIGALLFTIMFFTLIKYNHTYDVLSRLFLLIVFIMATLSVSIAEEGTRAVWLVSLIVAAFYFRDGKEGLIWTAIFVCITLIKEYFNFLNESPLTFVDSATLIANFILISLVLTWYETIKTREQKNLILQNELLEAMVSERTKKLEELTHTDELTGLYNRRYLFDIGERLLNTQAREQKSFAFVMVDIDYFKQYNDKYGHDAGDIALKKIAQAIKDNLSRGTDYAFRLGGEEFVILMINVSKEDVINHIEKIRNAILELHLKHKGSDIGKYVTASFGIEYCIPTKQSKFDKIYSQADKKLYQAKEEGRNKTIF